jgi:AraC family transcriptional regulator, arabinose operon regulatory protein
MTVGSACLHLLQDGLLYTADEAVATTTRRHPAVLLLSLDRRRLVLSASGREVSGEALLVMPQVTRRIQAPTGVFAALQVEPSHALFPRFVARREASEVDAVDAHAFAPLVERLRQAHQQCGPAADMQGLFDAAVDTLCGQIGGEHATDQRITDLIAHLRTQAPDDYSFDELLQRACVSPSRLSHLFSERAGLSLRSFASWRKLRNAIRLLTTDMSLTAVAHSSGFADSAHFARTFSTSLGLIPSDFRCRDRVRIHDHSGDHGIA